MSVLPLVLHPEILPECQGERRSATELLHSNNTKVLARGDEGLTDWSLKFHAILTLKRATLSSSVHSSTESTDTE